MFDGSFCKVENLVEKKITKDHSSFFAKYEEEGKIRQEIF